MLLSADFIKHKLKYTGNNIKCKWIKNPIKFFKLDKNQIPIQFFYSN